MGWIEQIPFCFLCATRAYGIWLLLPLLGPHSIGGGLIRNTFVLLISFPVMLTQWGRFEGQLPPMELLSWIVKELIIGLLIGFSVTLPFWAIDIASYFIDTLRGASMGTLLNPLLGVHSSIFGLFFTQALSVMFFSFGGFHTLMRTLYDSYQIFPVGGDFFVNSAWLTFLYLEWETMFRLAWSFALPSVVIMLLTDLALGFMNRAAQQLNVFFLSMPLKSAVVLFLMAMSLEFSLMLYSKRLLAFNENFLEFLKKIV